MRVQEVEIFLNFIGNFELPIPEPTPEELEELKKIQLKRKRNREAVNRYQTKMKEKRRLAEQQEKEQKKTVDEESA